MSVVDALKALADPVRLRMVGLLSEAPVLCSCEIEAILQINQSNASRHLARLRQAGIVNAQKDGHWVHYTLAQSGPHRSLVEEAVSLARADDQDFALALDHLHQYQSSPHTCETIGSWQPGGVVSG